MSDQQSPGFEGVVVLDIQDSVAVISLGDEPEHVVTFTEKRMQSLEAALKEVSMEKGLSGLVITGPRLGMFCAGADVNIIKSITDQAEAKRLSVQGQAVFNRLEALKIPTIAAISGPCAGGGFEMSLACDYRVCVDHPSVKVGLPEVKLGILPGFGGTQRLPKLIGLPKSLEVMMQGKMYSASRARKLQLVDKVFKPTVSGDKEVFSEFLNFAKDIAKAKTNVSKPKISLGDKFLTFTAPGRKIVTSQAASKLAKTTGGHYPAPEKIIEIAALGLSTDKRGGLEKEAQALAELLVTPVSKALLHLYFLTEDSTKRWKGFKDELVSAQAGVIGAGTMGAGIAATFLMSGVSVVLIDQQVQALDKAKERIKGILEKRFKYQPEKISPALSNLKTSTELSAVAESHIVIEAIIEDLSVKQDLFNKLTDIISDDAILASNTSSLPISDIAESIENPSRVVGMHFFNPVEKMPLVEVVRSPKTDDRTVAHTATLSAMLKKYPVVVEEVPGFLVNRLLTPYLVEAAHALSDGKSIQEIDKAAISFGMPMGPLRLLDEVGLDVAGHVSEILEKAYGERMRGPGFAAKLASQGRLGRKNGRGFYRYEGRDAVAEETLVSGILGLNGNGSSGGSRAELADRLILPMLNEAVRCLDEGVAGQPGKEAAEQIDLATVMGTGFAPFRGGILHYADFVGAQGILKKMQSLKGVYGNRVKPAEGIEARAALDLSFYEPCSV